MMISISLTFTTLFLFIHDFPLMAITTLFAMVILVTLARNSFQMHLENFLALSDYSKQKEKSESLLTNLLPSHILSKFYLGSKMQMSLTDVLQNCTLLFADIAGFTSYSASVPPEQLVNMLRNLMTDFDK